MNYNFTDILNNAKIIKDRKKNTKIKKERYKFKITDKGQYIYVWSDKETKDCVSLRNWQNIGLLLGRSKITEHKSIESFLKSKTYKNGKYTLWCIFRIDERNIKGE